MANCELGKHSSDHRKTELYWVCPACVSAFHGETAKLTELELLKAEQALDTRRPWFTFVPYAAIATLALVIVLLVAL
jgi:hypothetical protein